MLQVQEDLLKCLAAVLNLGNIEFGNDNSDHLIVKGKKTGPLASVEVSVPLGTPSYLATCHAGTDED